MVNSGSWTKTFWLSRRDFSRLATGTRKIFDVIAWWPSGSYDSWPHGRDLVVRALICAPENDPKRLQTPEIANLETVYKIQKGRRCLLGNNSYKWLTLFKTYTL